MLCQSKIFGMPLGHSVPDFESLLFPQPHFTVEPPRAFRSEKKDILTADRCVEETEASAAKGEANASALESVFSATMLPVNFFRDILRGHSAKGLHLGCKHFTLYRVFCLFNFL